MGFTIITDSTICANRPDLILVLKEERLAYLVDFSSPFDDNVSHKEIEKADKYQNLLLETERMWNVRVEIVPIMIGALGAFSSKFTDWLKRLNITLHPSVLQKAVLLETAVLLCWMLNIHL